jgi:O-methyltransferase
MGIAKQFIKNLAARHGITISRRVERPIKTIGDFQYEPAHPEATYAPWLADQRFQQVFSRIRQNTLGDKYRCYELWELVPQVAHLPGAVLEVGVWRGGTGCLLAANTSKPVILCDTFAGVVKTSEHDTTYRGSEHADASAEVVAQPASDLSVKVDICQGIFPDDFPELAREVFAFVHVDVDVYKSAKETMAAVWPRMPIGGIVVFDDYGFETCDGITKLVHELREPNRITIHNLNGHAVMIKMR